MRGKIKISDIAAALCLLVVALAFVMSVRTVGGPSDSHQAASILSRVLERKLERLDNMTSLVLQQGERDWMDVGKIPDDMVIYKYVDDSLATWHGEFPTVNDNIYQTTIFVSLSDPQYDLDSPLSDIGDDLVFRQIGPKWFILRRTDSGRVSIISGLEVDNNRPPLSGDFSISPLSDTGGDVVTLGGQPMFRIVYEYSHAQFVHNGRFVWVGLMFLILGCIILLRGHRSRKTLYGVLALGLVSLALVYAWGMERGSDLIMFSPILYADGWVFYSLGAVMIINLAILLLVLCCYICRGVLGGSTVRCIWRVLSSAAIFIYSYYALRSIVLNSGISLELYKVSELTDFTGYIYCSFISVLVCPLLLLQMCKPQFKRLLGCSFNPFSTTFTAIYSVLVGALLLTLTSALGYKKEQGKLEVWANRLAVDRDISLELQLRSVESSIAGDPLISTFSMMNNSSAIILSRLTESYMRRISQDYDISVYIYNPEHRDYTFDAFLNDRMNSGTALYDGSNFLFSLNVGGHVRYTGLFSYFNQQQGLRHLLVNIEPKTNRQDRGYASILGYSEPGKLVIPNRYSYAKYKDGGLSIYRGAYPYPTVYGDDLFNDEGFTHFKYPISEDEVVVISRPLNSLYNFATAFMLISLFMFFCAQVPLIVGTRARRQEKSYFRRRISVVLMFSLIITLVAMAAVSVTFVYKRNNANMESMMSDKVVSIQSQVESRCRYALSAQDLNTQEMSGVLEVVRDLVRADITLYTVEGVAFKSTSPEFFQKAASGVRLDSDAYYNIVRKHKLYHIGHQKYNGDSYYSLYAPVFNDEGKMIAILSSPYTDDSYDFQRDAAIHSVTIISLFLILLIVARFLVMNVVARIFRPLLEMSRKMNASNVEQLEFLTYDRDDEIADLVTAYNSMVRDLSESTRELARAERDNAWSGMARSVAHEINNSLSPMKLQLQRLIRLKEKNAPGWEERFDEISKVVLDQIDVLSDTATQFLTFAKLYNENPVEINIDNMLREQSLLFEGRDNITVDYIGLAGARVLGPKPQLTRVVVNLITNALQAVDPESGKVMVSVRNSSVDGFYDIVVEDNGPGVSDENLSKLFTPNFTTKNSGTGIGLAICKSILDMCGATISYSKSFVLGGAAFIIRYPKL